MTSEINAVAVLILLALLIVLIGGPILLLAVGVRKFRHTRSVPSRIMIGIGTAFCLTYLAAIAYYIISVGPGRSGIVTQGISPGGQEYCVVQTFKDIVEPYQVSFYIRDTNGIWRWNYLEHEDNAWRSAGIEFSGERVIISRNGKPFREISMPTGTVDITSVPGGYRDDYCPAEFSVQEVLEFHNKKCR